MAHGHECRGAGDPGGMAALAVPGRVRAGRVRAVSLSLGSPRPRLRAKRCGPYHLRSHASTSGYSVAGRVVATRAARVESPYDLYPGPGRRGTASSAHVVGPAR